MGKSATVTHRGEDYFLTVQAPAPRLTLSSGLCTSRRRWRRLRESSAWTYRSSIRATAFATPDRFPETPVTAKWPDEALAEAPLDRFNRHLPFDP